MEMEMSHAVDDHIIHEDAEKVASSSLTHNSDGHAPTIDMLQKELFNRPSTIKELRIELKKQVAAKRSLLAAANDSMASRPHTTTSAFSSNRNHRTMNTSEISRHVVQRDWMLTHGVANQKLRLPSTITTVVGSWVKAAEQQNRMSLNPSEIPQGAPKLLVDVVSNRPPLRRGSSTAPQRADRARARAVTGPGVSEEGIKSSHHPQKLGMTPGVSEEGNDAKRWRDLEAFLVRPPQPGEPKLPQTMELPNGLVMPMSDLLMRMRRSSILDAVMKGGDRRHHWAHVASSEEGIKSQLHAFGSRPPTTTGAPGDPSPSSRDETFLAQAPDKTPSHQPPAASENGRRLPIASMKGSMTSELLDRATQVSSPSQSPRSFVFSPRGASPRGIIRECSANKTSNLSLNLSQVQSNAAETASMGNGEMLPSGIRPTLSSKSSRREDEWASSLERERERMAWQERERAQLEAKWSEVDIKASLTIDQTESDVNIRMTRNQSSETLPNLEAVSPSNSKPERVITARSKSPSRNVKTTRSPSPSPNSQATNHLPRSIYDPNGLWPLPTRSSTAPLSSSRSRPPQTWNLTALPSEIKEPGDTIALLSSMTSKLEDPLRRSTSPSTSTSPPQFLIKGTRQATFSSPSSPSPKGNAGFTRLRNKETLAIA